MIIASWQDIRDGKQKSVTFPMLENDCTADNRTTLEIMAVIRPDDKGGVSIPYKTYEVYKVRLAWGQETVGYVQVLKIHCDEVSDTQFVWTLTVKAVDEWLV